MISVVSDVITFGGSDHTIRLWKYAPETKAAKYLQMFMGHTNSIMAVSWVQKEFRMFSASADATLRLWDIGTGRCVRVRRSVDGSGYLSTSSSTNKLFYACLTMAHSIEIISQSNLSLLYNLQVLHRARKGSRQRVLQT